MGFLNYDTIAIGIVLLPRNWSCISCKHCDSNVLLGQGSILLIAYPSNRYHNLLQSHWRWQLSPRRRPCMTDYLQNIITKQGGCYIQVNCDGFVFCRESNQWNCRWRQTSLHWRHLSVTSSPITCNSVACSTYCSNQQQRKYQFSIWQALRERKTSLTDGLTSQRAQIAKCMGPAWGPPGSCRPQMGPMYASSDVGPMNIVIRAVIWTAFPI